MPQIVLLPSVPNLFTMKLTQGAAAIQVELNRDAYPARASVEYDFASHICTYL